MHRLLFCTAVLFVTLFTVNTKAQVAQPHNDYTNKDFMQDREGFVQKYVVDPYKKHTKDKGDVREKVIQFLEAYRDFVSRDIGDLTTLKKLAQDALKTGSQDPLFLAHLAFCGVDNGANFRKSSSRALQKLKKSPYPALTTLKLRAGQLRWYKNPKNRKWLIADLKKQLVLAFKEAESPDQRFIWRFALATSACNSAEQRTLVDAVKEADVDPWLKAMFIGKLKHSMAWSARGNGFSHTVTEDNRKIFHELLDEAAIEFDKAISIQPGFPEAATEMIAIAMERRDSEKSPKDYFEAATAAQLDWAEAYKKLLRTMEPRWGGSIQQMADFGVKCAETERFDTNVPWQIMTCIKYARDEDGDILENEKVYQATKKVCQNYAAIASKQGDSEGVRKYESYLAASAFLAKQHQDIIGALERIDNEMDIEAFESMRVIGDGMLGRAVTRSSPAAKQCEALRDALSKGDMDPDKLTEKVRELEEIRDQVPTRGKLYVDALINQGITAIDYESGRWAKVNFEKGLIGWRRHGNWIAEPDTNSVLFSGGSDAKLYWDYPVKPPYAIEVSIEVLEADGSYAGEKAGIVAGEYATGQHDGAFLFIDRKQGSVGYDCNESCFWRASVSTKVRRMRVHVWKKYHATTVNGHFSRIIKDDDFDPTGSTGLGNMFGHSRTHTVRYSNFRIRKLDIDPPTKKMTDSFEYWNQWLEVEPDNAHAMYQLGRMQASRSVDNRDAAIAALTASGKLDPKAVETFLILGKLYLEKAQFAKAKAAFVKSVQNIPTIKEKYAMRFSHAIYELAKIEAFCSDETLRDGDAALKRAMRLKKMFPKNVFYDTLVASAWATVGDFDKAIQWQQKALKAEADSSLVAARRERLALYKAGKPFVNSPGPIVALSRKKAATKPVKWVNPVVAKGLVARWPFNSDGDEVVNEIESETINGFLTSKPNGKVDQAMDFDGRGYTSTKNLPDFSRGDFSYGGWINYQGGGCICRQFDADTGASNRIAFGKSGQGERTLSFELSSGDQPGGHVKIKAKPELPTRTWQHVFVTYDGSKKAKGAKIYINGKQVETVVIKDNLRGEIRNRGPFNIAQYDRPAGFFLGTIDELRVYDRALSPEEVATVVAYGENPTEAKKQLP